MSGPRDTAYAALRAGAPRPVIAGDAVEAFGARFATQNGSWARLGSPADIPAWLEARFAPPEGGTLAVAIANPALEPGASTTAYVVGPNGEQTHD